MVKTFLTKNIVFQVVFKCIVDVVVNVLSYVTFIINPFSQVSEYLIHVDKRLTEENERLLLYLDQSTK